MVFSALLTAPSVSQAQAFTNIESAEYDPINDRWLVSNTTSIIAQASDYSLSYFGSAVANYGMEVMGDKLYVVHGALVKAYDLATAEEVMSVHIDGALFLNGMASDGVSTLWLTDYSGKRVFELDVTDLNAPVQSMIVENTVTTPNGIVHDPWNNRLVFVSWGGFAPIKAISLDDHSVSTVAETNWTNCDGIDIDGAGNFYVTSWSPSYLTKYPNDFSSVQVVSISQLASPGDICYAQEIDVLAVPNVGDQTLALFFFEPTTTVSESAAAAGEPSIHPNPLTSNSVLEFDPGPAELLDLRIIDASGRSVRSLLGDAPSGITGSMRVKIDPNGLVPGLYSAVLLTTQGKSSALFVVPMD